jgi:hypothetical protein
MKTNDYPLFIELLKKKWDKNIQDFSQLEAINKSVGLNTGSYNASKIVFKNIDLGRNYRPIGTYSSSTCELHIDLTLNEPQKGRIVSPFSSYSMSIQINSNVVIPGQESKIVKSLIKTQRKLLILDIQSIICKLGEKEL